MAIDDKFPEKKVLTISMRDYVEYCSDRELEYVIAGVHAINFDEFLKKVPKDAEIVVDFRAITFSDNNFNQRDFYSGTALISRKNK